MIKMFDDLYDATYFVESMAEEAMYEGFYFRVELYRTPDSRWRVGVFEDGQLELDLEGTRD